MQFSKATQDDWRLQQLREIARKPYFRDVLGVDDIERMIKGARVTLSDLLSLVAFLDLVSNELNTDVDAARILVLTADWKASERLTAQKTMAKLFDSHPLQRELETAIAISKGRPNRSPYPRRARKFSVFPEDLPLFMRVALSDMSRGLPGDSGTVPVASIVETTRTKMCEYAKAAQDAGLDVALSIDAAIAYERSLVRREVPLSPRTILSAIRQVRDFARYVGADAEFLDHLAARIRRHENRARTALPQKEAKVLALPDYAGIFGMALDLLGSASNTENPRVAQFRRNAAVAITLFCPFPFRAADTRLRFGKEITWDGECYALNLEISKTRRRFRAPVIPVFGWFIDHMILQGASSEHLEWQRTKCFAKKRSLFVNYDDTEVHGRYVSYLWQRVLGTGCHAARTHLHDSFGRMGSRGVELAMRACDHRSEKTAEAYRTRAFDFLSLERTHDDFRANILDEEWNDFFGKPVSTPN